MIRCDGCGVEQLPGALYCEECGESLLASEEAPDGKAYPFTNVPRAPHGPTLVGQHVEPHEKATFIRFVIPSSGRRIRLSLNETIRIGRADPTASLYPEVDLTADGGAEYGVSRLHATISYAKDGVVIMDMNSTNGTLLNNHSIPAELPYPLSNGDELRLGDLLVHVFLE